MSNLIKSVYFNVDKDDKVVVNTNDIIKQMPIFKKEDPLENFEFVPGINVVNIDSIIEEQREAMQENADNVMIEARRQADSIIADAKQEAERILSEARQSGMEQGYREGLLKADNEINAARREYEDKCEALREQFDTMVAEAEPQIAELICSIVERLTGIVVEDKKDAIIYIIEKSLKELPPSDTYTLHVSGVNLADVMQAKNRLQACIGYDAVFDIEEDVTLAHDQCIIETDTHVIDCSIDVQLDNLRQELRLISMQ